MIALLCTVLAAAASAPQSEESSVHAQVTVAVQAHPAFSAAYTGKNSLTPDAESATSIVGDLFLGLRLWPGAELYAQPEVSGGRGLSSTLGIAAFPSGEVYRVGEVAPVASLARALLRQTFGFGGGSVPLDAGPNQLGGARARDALTLSIGKLAVPDLVDSVPASNDPHRRFLSWGLFASGAYDYPADTRGYTWGATADLSIDSWSARAGIFLEPKVANELDLEPDVTRTRGLVAEVERRFTLFGRPAAVRALGFLNTAHMGSYREALARTGTPDVTATRADGRTKAGVAASANAEFAAGLSGFARASWNDGANESWAFTEIDRSFAAGAIQSGARWGRPSDEAGLAFVVSGLSGLHRRYLAAGGAGFILGDGGLRFGPEILAEAFYRLALDEHVAVSGHYQPVVNPGFNRDRGPVHIFSVRVHAEF